LAVVSLVEALRRAGMGCDGLAKGYQELSLQTSPNERSYMKSEEAIRSRHCDLEIGRHRVRFRMDEVGNQP
jgi:hypothetical protein